MTITIAPLTVSPACNCNILQAGLAREEHLRRYHKPITYWGIYVDEKYVSYTSSKEFAEKTKRWVEKWLRDRLSSK
ncbi:MAG TPA: hypothetical protein VLB01_07915 [Thermodesulfobacteriota bacterium]|nr:hypothetical protein [Thermodesulfobacteriota bacterium]